MKLWIPLLGSRLRLVKQWCFWLHCEQRNRSLWDQVHVVPMDDIPYQHRKDNEILVTLVPGTELTVDRIYIRKEQSHHNSVTFKAKIKFHGTYRPCRFWVTVEDYNNGLNVEVIR